MRVRLTAVSMVLLLPLALAACGGSSSNSIREEAIADLTSQLTEAGESQAVIDCMTAVINGLSDDDVGSIGKRIRRAHAGATLPAHQNLARPIAATSSASKSDSLSLARPAASPWRTSTRSADGNT